MVAYGKKAGWTDVVIHDKIKRFDVYGEAKIAISPEEWTYSRLIIPKNGGKPTFTMLYMHRGKKLQIRTDSAHGPHIDVEVDGKQIAKPFLEDVKTLIESPDDYQYTTNMILRIAEKYCNPLAGVLYWVFPSGVDSMGLIDMFSDCKTAYGVKTTLTDMARFVSIRAFQEISKGKRLGVNEYLKIILDEFESIAKIEKKNGGIGQEARDVKYQPANLFAAPFPIMFREGPDLNTRTVAYDENGNVTNNVVPFGVTYTF